MPKLSWHCRRAAPTASRAAADDAAPGGPTALPPVGQPALSNNLANACEAAAALFRLQHPDGADSGGAAHTRLDPKGTLGQALLQLLAARRTQLRRHLPAPGSPPQGATRPPGLGAGALAPYLATRGSSASGPGGMGNVNPLYEASGAPHQQPVEGSKAVPSETAAAAPISALSEVEDVVLAVALPEVSDLLGLVINGLEGGRTRVWLVPFEALNPEGCPPQVGARAWY
jgi:hypothetical protein